MPELIDRAKLFEYLAAIKPDEYISAYGEAAVDVINHVETYVSEMPTIEAEPVRHGRWIDNESRCYPYKCTSCNTSADWHYKFCPYCGSKNEGD